MDSNFICYCLQETIDKKYDYLKQGILSYNPQVMTTLAYLIEANKLDNILVKNKIFANLYQAGAERNIPVSMLNYAKCLRNGKGVKRNIDQACVFYHKSMNSGYLEARKQLDEIHCQANDFKQKVPEYQVLGSGDYEEYEDQEIILL